jgi:hypothetical protein
MGLKVAQFLAVVLTALSLVPAGAHLFELFNKINLVQEQYFVVQGIYRGWNLFGFVLFPAVLADFVLALLLRGRGASFSFALAAALCLAATLVIFFIWIYPTNVATNNWTTVPANWEALRRQWEYSHAVNAVLTLISLNAVVLSLLSLGGITREIGSH